MPKSFNSGKSFGIVQARDKIIDGTLIKAAGLFINSSLNYKTAPAEKPGQGGFPFAFWQLLHYITVQSIDRDARSGILFLKSYLQRFNTIKLKNLNKILCIDYFEFLFDILSRQTVHSIIC